MDSLLNCCSFIDDYIPKSGLKVVPATILGLFVSFIFLAMIHHKNSGLSFLKTLKELFLYMFVSNPCFDHDESMSCKHDNCVRCNKYKETRSSIVNRWKKLNNGNEKLARIEEAVRSLHISKDVKSKKSSSAQHQQKPTLFSMNLPSNPWWTDFDVCKIERSLLKVNFSIILEEYENIYMCLEKGNINGWKRNEIPEGHWCIFPLIDQGVINEENCQRCPNTAALLNSLPSLMSDCIFGNAFFSLLYPDSYIEPHYGPTNIRIRCHFGLETADDCRLEVCGKQYKWIKEDSILFDDSFEHSAFYTEQKLFTRPRAILLLDFWHPDISEDEKKALKKILSPSF